MTLVFFGIEKCYSYWVQYLPVKMNGKKKSILGDEMTMLMYHRLLLLHLYKPATPSIPTQHTMPDVCHEELFWNYERFDMLQSKCNKTLA